MSSRMLRLMLAALMVTAIVLVAGCSAGGAQTGGDKYPAKPVELVAAGDPGGGLDIHARGIEQAMTVEKLNDTAFTISNKGSGGGNITTSYMVTQKGSGYALAINSNRVLMNPLLGTIEYTIKDMTPVARLTTEFEVWAVRADSKYTSAKQIIDDLKKDPKAVTFGIGTMPSNEWLNAMIPAKMNGVDPTKMNIVAFSSGGDLMAQLLGGQIPVASSTPSEYIAQADAGKIRVLAISSPNRIPRLKDTPTWKELGMDLTIYHWRGIFGPPDMPKTAYDYWQKKFGDMVKTKTWQDFLAKQELYDAYLPGDQFKTQLEKDNVVMDELLTTVGLKKAK